MVHMIKRSHIGEFEITTDTSIRDGYAKIFCIQK